MNPLCSRSLPQLLPATDPADRKSAKMQPSLTTPTRIVQTRSCENGRLYRLLKLTWNTHQRKLCFWATSASSRLRRAEVMQYLLLGSDRSELEARRRGVAGKPQSLGVRHPRSSSMGHAIPLKGNLRYTELNENENAT